MDVRRLDPSHSLRSKALISAACVLPLIACSASSPENSAASNDAGIDRGSIHGSLDGTHFDHVAAAWLIGAPDDPKQTRVIYVFDRAIACADIARPGWDQTVADATQSLELKLIGTRPDTYEVAAGGRPATGEADVNYTQTSTTGTPTELSATAGDVKLAHFADGKSADGTFDLSFEHGAVAGEFRAEYCATGHEP